MFSQTFCITPRARPVSGACARLHFAVAVPIIAAACAATPATATTLFQEDFENYAVGSNLSGQGGWGPDHAYGGALNVGNGTFLPGKVLNGLDRTNSTENLSARPLGFALDPSRITTLAFDAYAHNPDYYQITVIGLGNLNGINFEVGGPNWIGSYRDGWYFDARGFLANPSALFIALGGKDTPVKMSIVVDGVANEVYGVYDFGGGGQQTPHYAVTDAQIATLNEVGIEFDFRNGKTAAELDNLRVFDNVASAVPEPGTALLASVSLALLGFARRPRQSR